MPDYALHGLAMRSEIPLNEEATAAENPDLEVTYGAGDPAEVELHSLIAEYTAYGRTWFQAYELGASRMLRFPELADFIVSSDLRHIEALSVDGTAEEALGLLLIGTTLAFNLELRNECVLHAAAVDIGGIAVAFAGTTGRGKSTVAALLCALGTPFVTDDVLRVGLGDGGTAFRGTSWVRLREQAASLLDLFDTAPPTRRTYDERLAVAPRRSAEQLPLGAIVLPRPNRTIEHVNLERLSGAPALFGLLDAARFKGWVVKAHQQRQFEQFAELSRQVPVYRADLPWGEPATKAVGEELHVALKEILGQ